AGDMNNVLESHDVAFSADGQRLAATGQHGVVWVWDAASGRQVFTLKTRNYQALGLAFSPDGRLIASAGGKDVRVWNTATGCRKLLLKGHTSGVISVAFSPDGRRLASASRDVRLWDVG